MNQEAQHFGLEIDWTKTKIHTITDPPPVSGAVQAAGNTVEIVDKFTYLGCQIDRQIDRTGTTVRQNCSDGLLSHAIHAGLYEISTVDRGTPRYPLPRKYAYNVYYTSSSLVRCRDLDVNQSIECKNRFL